MSASFSSTNLSDASRQSQGDRTVDASAPSFATVPSLSSESTGTAATLSGHSVGAEGHLPAASIETKDTVNPFLADRAAVQPGMSDPARLDASSGEGQPRVLTASASSAPVGVDPALITANLPPPTHGEDAKLQSHLSLVAADIKTQANNVGAHVKAGWQTAGLQTKDTYAKLKHKAQEMKENYQTKRRNSLEQKERERA